jgi:hypothetical protein
VYDESAALWSSDAAPTSPTIAFSDPIPILAFSHDIQPFDDSANPGSLANTYGKGSFHIATRSSYLGTRLSTLWREGSTGYLVVGSIFQPEQPDGYPGRTDTQFSSIPTGTSMAYAPDDHGHLYMVTLENTCVVILCVV